MADESIRAPDRNGPRIIAEMHQEGFARLHRHRICPAFSPNLPTLVQAASSGELARRNVNTDRPISLIGPIRSNARHSPTLYTVAVRHGGVPESRHCSYGCTCAPYVHPRVCTDMCMRDALKNRQLFGRRKLFNYGSNGNITDIIIRSRYVIRNRLSGMQGLNP